MKREKFASRVNVRLEQDIYQILESEASSLGYKNLAPYIRSIIDKRHSHGSRKAELPAGAVTAIEHLTAEVRRIGVLYNQFVAAYNKAILLKDKYGNPSISVKETQRNQLGLMDLTMELTGKVHSLMDYIGVSHDRAKVRNEQPTEKNRSSQEDKIIIPKL